MAKVLISLKIFPSDVNTDLEALKKKIEDCLPDFASVYKFEEEPIAFGLVAIIAHLLVPEDKAGGIDEVEMALKKIDTISNFQTLTIRRV
ncbi:TPA: elongation factor 1-beta [Candidatus Bathyarchaeota archaeon]|nr:elongation factor 1-beta [Candidatus Bathyarchaeota archaeon]